MIPKLYIIALIIVSILITGVILFSLRDSQEARIDIYESEQAELHGVPEFSDVEDIKQLLKETDFLLFKGEQARLKLEQEVKEYEERN